MLADKKSKNIYFAVAFLVVIILIVLILTTFFSIYSTDEDLGKGKVIINDKVISVEVAQTPETREIGLKGRSGLKENQGMLFVFKDKRYYNFWMEGMKFPIDIIWIDDNKIIDITKNATPPAPEQTDLPIYRPLQEVNYVLEVKAGFVESNNIKIGDEVEINYK